MDLIRCQDLRCLKQCVPRIFSPYNGDSSIHLSKMHLWNYRVDSVLCTVPLRTIYNVRIINLFLRGDTDAPAQSHPPGSCWPTSRIRAIHTSSGFSVCTGPVPFCVSTDSGVLGAGHFHFGRASMAKVGVMKLKVPPWRIGNLWVSGVKALEARGYMVD